MQWIGQIELRKEDNFVNYLCVGWAIIRSSSPQDLRLKLRKRSLAADGTWEEDACESADEEEDKFCIRQLFICK